MAVNYLEFVSPNMITFCSRSLNSVLHFNVRSAQGKHDTITHLLSEFSFKFDIVMMTETWYNEGCDTLCLEGYKNFFVNRTNRRGGGVALYTDTCKNFEILPEYSAITDDYEFLCVKNGSELATVVYRPPNGNLMLFMNYFEAMLEYARSNNFTLICGGDFNINVLDDTPIVRDFTTRLLSSGFVNIIKTPTRVTVSTSSALDLLITNCETVICDAGTLAWEISDHCPIFMRYHAPGKTGKRQCDAVTVQCISDDALEAFKSNISSQDWSCVYEKRNVNDAYLEFLSTFTNIYMKHFPFKTFRPSRKIRKPWVTPAHKREINRKNKLFHAFLKTRCPTALKKFKDVRNKLNAELRRAKATYYENIFGNISNNDSSAAWNAVNKFLGHERKNASPEEITHENRVYTGDALAEFFNKHFIGINTPATNPLLGDDLANIYTESMFLHPTDEVEVYRTFMSLKNTRALDIDNLQIRPIKTILEFIVPVLAYIFNLSIELGEFPDAMKRSRVSVVYKGGDKNVPKNYRPISIIPIFAKAFEKILHYRLNNFFQRIQLLSESQHGFRKGRSTESALLELKEHVLINIQKKLITLALFIDFSKAFDSLDHKILAHKLSICGIRGKPLSLIRSYLTNRSQYVCIGTHKSSLLTITTGVPQGSVLGPLLFNVYINSIVNIDLTVKFIIYADDCTVLLSGPDATKLAVDCNNILDKIVRWSSSNSLKMNPSKTKVMFFRARNKAIRLEHVIRFGNDDIEIVEEHTILGITLSSNLSWDSHISNLCKNLASVSGAMSRCRALPLNIKIKIYYALFASRINYCSLVWLTTTKTNIQKVVILQKKVIRQIANLEYCESTQSAFQIFNIIRIKNMYDYRVLASFYHSNKIFRRFLETTASLTVHRPVLNTRSTDTWFLPRFRTDYKLQMLQYNLPLLLNKYKETKYMSKSQLRAFFVKVL